jgi:hypothetical protein
MINLLAYAQVVEACYEPTAIPTFQDPSGLTHVFVTEVEGVLHFNFNGTLDAAEWINRDLDAIGLETFRHLQFGILHDGFARGAYGVVGKIVEWLSNLGYPAYTIGGHSKGAGEAQVAAAELKYRRLPPSEMYLFEPPRAGGEKLLAYLGSIPTYATQTYNQAGNDLVTEIPTEPWVSPASMIRLKVSDSYDIATKHKIPAVIEALQRFS